MKGPLTMKGPLMKWALVKEPRKEPLMKGTLMKAPLKGPPLSRWIFFLQACTYVQPAGRKLA